MKTDHIGLFEYTLEVLTTEEGQMEVCTKDLYTDTPEGFNLNIQTTYEKKFMAEGYKINYLRFIM